MPFKCYEIPGTDLKMNNQPATPSYFIGLLHKLGESWGPHG